VASLLKRAPALPFAAYATKSKLTPRTKYKNCEIFIARYAFTLSVLLTTN